jgi:hypothetical protein
MGSSYKDTKHTGHNMRRYHYVRNEITANHFIMSWLGTKLMILGIDTKQLPGPQHEFLAEPIHIQVKD